MRCTCKAHGVCALRALVIRAILKHGMERSGLDRTNALIRGMDRTVEGVVIGVVCMLIPLRVNFNIVASKVQAQVESLARADSSRSTWLTL